MPLVERFPMCVHRGEESKLVLDESSLLLARADGWLPGHEDAPEPEPEPPPQLKRRGRRDDQ